MDEVAQTLEHITDIAVRLVNKPLYTMFLSPAILLKAPYIAKMSGCKCKGYGGYDDAERQVLAFYLDDEPADYPIACVEVITPIGNKMEHRQVMGSVLALGLKRDVLGDIVINENKAYLFCIDKIANHIVDSIDKIGSFGAKLKIVDIIPQLEKAQGQLKRFTVSSLRLDGILSAGLNLSRGKALLLVSQGLVSVNHTEATKPEMRLAQGDIVSIRGYGRMLFTSLGGLTKKERIAVEFELFLKKKK